MLHIQKISIPIKKDIRYNWQYMTGTYNINNENNNTPVSPFIFDKINESKTNEMQIDKSNEIRMDKENEIRMDKSNEIRMDKENEIRMDKENEILMDKENEIHIDKNSNSEKVAPDILTNNLNTNNANRCVHRTNNIRMKNYSQMKNKKYIKNKDMGTILLNNNLFDKNRDLYDHNQEINSYIRSKQNIYKKSSDKNNYIKYIYSVYILHLKYEKLRRLKVLKKHQKIHKTYLM